MELPPRDADKFKKEAIRQVINNNYSLQETLIRVGRYPDLLKMLLKQLSQSPLRVCLNNRTDGYHGESSLSISQRQSGIKGSIIVVGLPRAADK